MIFMRYSYKLAQTIRKIKKTVEILRKFHWKYKNLIFLTISIVVSYLLVTSGLLLNFITKFSSVGYFSSFVAGLFFSYGLTTPIATASLYLLGKILNPFFVAFVGAFGAVSSDYLIFWFVKDRLLEEIKLASEELGVKLPNLRKTLLKSRNVIRIAPFIAGIIVASPLPDEFAAVLFAAVKYELKKFILYSYLFNFFGILIIALLGRG